MVLVAICTCRESYTTRVHPSYTYVEGHVNSQLLLDVLGIVKCDQMRTSVDLTQDAHRDYK
jgi:hypothetical protein